MGKCVRGRGTSVGECVRATGGDREGRESTRGSPLAHLTVSAHQQRASGAEGARRAR